MKASGGETIVGENGHTSNNEVCYLYFKLFIFALPLTPGCWDSSDTGARGRGQCRSAGESPLQKCFWFPLISPDIPEIPWYPMIIPGPKIIVSWSSPDSGWALYCWGIWWGQPQEGGLIQSLVRVVSNFPGCKKTDKKQIKQQKRQQQTEQQKGQKQACRTQVRSIHTISHDHGKIIFVSGSSEDRICVWMISPWI